MSNKRADYWNKSYSEYWQKRVAESKTGANLSSIQDGDKVTEGDEIYFEIFEDFHPVGSSILDVGCGWGRFFPFFAQKGLSVFGIDISFAMLEIFKRNEVPNSSVISPVVAEAESLPYKASSFDNVACLAVFDATMQEKALTEFMRVLKKGGRLYITGKNNNYSSDDVLAYEAELGACRKGHPNSFTDLKLLLDTFVEAGHTIVAQFFFPSRGDFAKKNFHENINMRFYEYFVILEKNNDNQINLSVPISSPKSLVRLSKEKNE
ncbi:class I SAM-dependent methyltransferase [Alphaproteobacteria bacterium]|nr:class I SAM-dependent methyltransferase [Alphaproteobacteria bacterium]